LEMMVGRARGLLLTRKVVAAAVLVLLVKHQRRLRLGVTVVPLAHQALRAHL